MKKASDVWFRIWLALFYLPYIAWLFVNLLFNICKDTETWTDFTPYRSKRK